MLRLHEFITIIRNCKTIAEQRAEYQKEMAAIRESFAKNQETLRPRNVTKLLFINMSGQQTNFGQMECLKLITANSLIQKRIGYLGLTQLFHQKSQLLMMATNRLRVDLGCMNNNIVGLVLCVLSEICTTQLSRQLHNQVLKCISNNSSYIRKKAILTSIKLIKKCPEYITQFLPKIASCLQQKNHGVLLSCMAFIQNVLLLDQAHIGEIVNLVPRIAKVYKLIANQHNAEYQIGGVQDPFLQVSILRLLRMLRKYNNTFDKVFAQVLVVSHDSVCSKVTTNLKNGANAVLFEAFQCFMLLQPTTQMRQYVSNVLSKFISVKDANSKYLSLFNLNLMTKYDLKIVKSHKGTIFECLNQNDLLIRVMALDLLYIIASPDNVGSIVKELLNTLLGATDEQFIAQLALKICLIVQKHSQSRRWHFDTILKVLILADQSVKEESAKSLIHLITSTPQLQEYCMAKLFFSTTQNLQNDALSKICLYLIGQLVQVLLRMKGIEINQTNVLDLIQSLIFRGGVAYDTISYGLSALLKLFQKFPSEKQRISKMIKSFVTHSDLEVQKRACQYVILIEPQWDEDRKKQVCIPVPPFRQTAQAFRNIPIGQTDLDLDLSELKMPGKPNVNYDQHISKQTPITEVREVQINRGPQQIKQDQTKKPTFKKNNENIFDEIMNDSTPQQVPKPIQNNKKSSLMDDDDIFGSITGGNQQKSNVNQGGLDLGFNLGATQPQQNNGDIFNMLNLNLGGNTNTPPQNQNFGGDLLGFGNSQPIQNNTNNFLGGGDLLGFSSNQPQNNGFNMNTNSVQQNTNQIPNKTVQNANKILAYENSQMQIWMNCQKQSHDTTKIIATYTNKTQSNIQNITIQAAVMKHLKLTINPLSSTTLGPLSKQSINQTMTVVNSAVGQKGIVMKMKLSYKINGQKLDFQQKIANFPAGM